MTTPPPPQEYANKVLRELKQDLTLPDWEGVEKPMSPLRETSEKAIALILWFAFCAYLGLVAGTLIALILSGGTLP